VEQQYDAVIVGGGHNGLITSSYLARSGMRVLVLERRDFVGGAVITEELWPGYSVPTCSYICYVLQPKIIDDMALREYGFDVHQLDPYSFMPFPDGRRIIGWQDESAMAREIAAFSERDAEAFPRFREVRTRMASIVHRFLLRPAPSVADLVDSVRGAEDEPLLDRLLFGSLTDLLDEYFESPEVKAAFVMAWDAGDPDVPGSLLSAIHPAISQFSRDEDVGVVVGGMGGITQAMARSVEAAGVTIRTAAEVAEILVENGRARGVRLVDGEEIAAGLVVSNADPKRTFLKLVPEDALPAAFRHRVARLKTDAAYLKFHAALDELPDFSRYLGANHDPRILAYINVRPSLDYARKSWHDAINGRVTDCPILAIQIPSVYDRTLVPQGGHVMSIWVQYAPVNPVDGSWDDLREQTGEGLIDVMAQYAPNIREVIRDWVLFTPLDIERRVGLTDGNIRHIDMIGGQLFNQRPLPGWSDYKTPVEGLYLCGAGTHPGGEVTGAPGHNAAHAILHDLAAVQS
jgi:phytoene dehydrogenase-like protein